MTNAATRAMNESDAMEAHYKQVKKALKKLFKDQKKNPTFVEEEHKFSIRLKGRDAITAEILGQGNRSAGIRMALTGIRHELGLKLTEKDN